MIVTDSIHFHQFISFINSGRFTRSLHVLQPGQKYHLRVEKQDIKMRYKGYKKKSWSPHNLFQKSKSLPRKRGIDRAELFCALKQS